jgi:hypothetical protein
MDKKLLHFFYTQGLSYVDMLREAMDASAQIPQEISLWIDQHISCPIRGFEHKKRANGNMYSHNEQLLATRHQLRLIAHSYLKRGVSTHEIVMKLKWFI